MLPQYVVPGTGKVVWPLPASVFPPDSGLLGARTYVLWMVLSCPSTALYMDWAHRLCLWSWTKLLNGVVQNTNITGRQMWASQSGWVIRRIQGGGATWGIEGWMRFRDCYRLNVSPPNLYVEILNLKVIVLEGEALNSPWGWSPHKWDLCFFIKENPECSLTPSIMWRQHEDSSPWTRRQPSPDRRSAGTLTLGFSAL